MSGEPHRMGYPIFDAQDPEVQRAVSRLEGAEVSRSDHHRREREERMLRRVEEATKKESSEESA